MKQHIWKELVEHYSRIELMFNNTLPPPATDQAITVLLESSQSDKLNVPEVYMEFLRMRNGTSFNGLMLYRAEFAQGNAAYGLDFVVMNQYHYTRGDATVLGTSDIDVYVVLGTDGPYRRLERTCWDTIEEFPTCEELLSSIFAAQLEVLERAE